MLAYNAVISRGSRVSSKDVLAFTTQLSTALRAGLPLMRGLDLIHEQQHKPGTKKLMGELVDAVNTGQSLSEAMANHEDVFSQLYLSMVRVGETGGMLDQTTAQLADMLTREEKIKSNMKNASMYPLFVLVLGLASVTLIITVILPRILGTLGAEVSALPLPTQILLGMSTFATGLFTTIPGWICIAVIIAGFFYFGKWKKHAGRLKYDTFKLDELLLNAADTFDAEADSAINKFMSIFPAILILLLALVIGFIIAATLLPIIAMELGGGMF